MIVGVVISNLLYLIVAIAVAVIGALVVVLRHRKPKSVEANVASFHRGLRALAPDQPPSPSGSGPSWGGASRRAVTTPSSFKRSATSAGDTTPETSAPSDGDLDPHADPAETDVEAAPEQADPATDETVEPGAETAAEDAEPGAGTADEDDEAGAETAGEDAESAVDPVHLTSRKRRPSSGSASRASDASGVPTEEAGTG